MPFGFMAMPSEPAESDLNIINNGADRERYDRLTFGLRAIGLRLVITKEHDGTVTEFVERLSTGDTQQSSHATVRAAVEKNEALLKAGLGSSS